MSAVKKKTINRASSGIKRIRNENVLLREVDPNEKKMHYVFWAGLDPIPCHEQNIGLARVEPFKVTSVDNWGCWTRDQDDKGSSGLKRHPDRAKRGGEVYDTRGKEAGANAEWLERCYAGKGLVILRDLTAIEPDLAATITDNLIPDIPEDGDYDTIIELIDKNRANNVSKENAKLQDKVANKLIEACEIGKAAGLNELSSKRSEIQERHVPNGKGIPKLDDRARRLIRLVGKTTADYEVDTKAAGDAAAAQVGKAISAMMPMMQQGQVPQVQNLMTPEQMEQQATIFALTMQKMGFGFAPPQGQIQGQVIPPTTTKPSGKSTQPPA